MGMLLAAAMVFTAMPDTYAYAAEERAAEQILEPEETQGIEKVLKTEEVQESEKSQKEGGIRESEDVQGTEEDQEPEEMQEAPGQADVDEDVPTYRLVKKGAPSEYGYQKMVWVDEDGNEIEGESAYEKPSSGKRRARAAFPSSYNMKDRGELPAVRDQGKWGTCWAHAAICSLESNMIKKGLASTSVDYAERHLAYFAHKRNATLGDGVDIYDTANGWGWYGAGQYNESIAALSGWYGAAAESDYPYSARGSMSDLAESHRSSSVCHVTAMNILETPEDVKRAIMNTSSVNASYYSKAANTAKVYHAEDHIIDHVISIVGWDDNYARTNFSDNGKRPQNNGAWRCRNSWGSSWGESGYFWISYEDATLRDFCSFEAEAVDNYDNIYQYDGAGWNTLKEYEKAANVFTAKSTEKLRAVSFRAYRNYDYQIEIYVEGEKAMTLPSSGVLVYSQKGSLEYPGYHTIPLDEEILLAGGMKYAVSVEFISKDSESPFIYMEAGDSYSSEAGQSFCGSNSWRDTKEISGNCKNVCIKAFTDHAAAADKSQLIALIEEAEQLKSSDYTSASWRNFQTGLEKARGVSQASNPTESEIIKAISSLQAGRNALALSKIYISNEQEFIEFAQSVTCGHDYKGQGIYLVNDLDMAGVKYKPAGSFSNKFTGTFDGGGYMIRNLSGAYSKTYGGLFGYIESGGTVKNVHLINVDISSGYNYTGGIAGRNKGTISGCIVEGNFLFEGNGRVGGIAGGNEGTIENCSVKGTMAFRGQKTKTDYVGGIVGYNTRNVSKCFAEGEIVSEDLASTGGVAGYSSGGVNLCYNLANIKGTPVGDTRTAGIAAFTGGSIYGCYNYGKIERSGGAESGAIYGSKEGTKSVSHCCYLNTSSAQAYPSSTVGSMTAEEFVAAKAAYYMNSNGGTEKNTREWSQRDGLPIWADSENKAVIKVTVRQDDENEYQADFNGMTSGEFYAKGGAEVELRILDELQVPADTLNIGVKGLTRSKRDKNFYILPETDVEAVIICRKSKVLYHLNGGSGAESGNYGVEAAVILPTPVKEGAEFLGWYDNENLQGKTVSSIPKGSTGDKEFWAKWDRINITDVEEFEAFALAVVSGNNHKGQTVYLLNDLDMAGVTHTSIGNYNNLFMGTFDGGGHTIRNFTGAYTSTYSGLFGYIGKDGEVKNINLMDVEFSCNKNYAGGIAGYNKGIIKGCTVEGNFLFTSNSYAGGIVGSNAGGVVEQSSANGTITFRSQSTKSYYAGGISGSNAGTVSKCSIEGVLVSDGMAATGGIAGYNTGVVQLCRNLAVISGAPASSTRTGGIAAYTGGTGGRISGCYNYGSIERSGEIEFGAIYGYKGGGIVSNCYYLNTSSIQAAPSSTEGSMTAEEFASSKTAYYLNSNGGTEENIYEWSQKDGLPVWADSENKAVIKVEVSQDSGNEYQASVNNMTEGIFYAKGRTEVEVQVLNTAPDYTILVEVTGLTRLDKNELLYALPETDVEAVARCRKVPIQYGITYHLNKGSGAETGTYDIETAVTLPIPVKSGAEFLGWYDNQNLTGNPVSEIPAGSTGAKEYWAKWSRMEIENVEEFEAFAQAVCAGNSYRGQTICLLNDLDMSGITHKVIGSSSRQFEGTFDGGGYFIRNFSCSCTNSYSGLFGCIGESGVVENVNLVNVDFSCNKNYTGSIAGHNKGTVRGCTVEGNLLFSGTFVGGIAGRNDGTIERSSVKGALTFHNQGTNFCYAGGITGYNVGTFPKGTVLKCFVEGEIAVEGVVRAGGIAGDSFGTVSLCYNLASISGNTTEDSRIGGIAASLHNTTGKIQGCYNYGKIDCSGGAAFGAVYGYKNSWATISNCYYLNTSSTQAAPSSTEGSMTAEEFASAKTAYYLNSNGGSKTNTCEWSQKDGRPVFADSENKAVIKVTVSQDSENAYQASLNGIADGEFYAKGGTEAELQAEADAPGYIRTSVEVTGLARSDRGENWYALPETDAEAVITCRRRPIEYDITYHLNRGSGAETGTYDIETAVTLPVPAREKAEFLGWYDNEAFTGAPVSEIPLGSTGNRELWAKWKHLGYEVIFPQKKGYEAVPSGGCVNGKIPEDGSYLFTLSASDGYDLSGVTVKCGNTVLLPSNGVYRIDHIMSDIGNLFIEGIRLGSGNYAVENYNGYVGRQAVITPVAPATGIRLAGDTEFTESITADTSGEARIVTCDEEGNISAAERVTFRRDTAAPVIASVRVSPSGSERHYKGVFFTVNANDRESGVSEYSFDSGETWQKENHCYEACEEAARVYGKRIQVRDYTGNVSEYTREVTIPAFVKYDSSTRLTSGEASYVYGTDIILRADITFEDAGGEASEPGTVSFFMADGQTAGAVVVERTGRTQGSAEIAVPMDVYGGIGEKAFQAVYSGKGTLYADSSSIQCRVRVEKAGIENPSFGDTETERGYRMDAGADVLGDEVLPVAGTVVVNGVEIPYRITWNQETIDLTAVGNTAEFTGTVTYENVPEWAELPESFTVSRRVTVKESSKTPVEITGVRPQNGTYNGQQWSGYAGTLPETYQGAYEIFYSGRGNTSYSSSDAPVNAGSYTVTIRVPEEDGEYIGSLSLNFEIEKADVTVTVKNKSVKAGSPVPDLTDADYTVSGLAEGETLPELPKLRYALAPDMARPGNIAITAGGARVPDGGNYHEEIHYVDGTLSITKQGSAVIVTPEKESYLYGEEIVLTADITFDCEVGGNTSYGEVQFVLSDSVLAGSAEVESLGGRRGRARLIIGASAYENTGEKYYRAMYDGTDTPYDSSTSEDCRVEVRKRAVEPPVLEDIETECGKDASAGAGVLGEKVLPRSGTVTVYGTEIPYRITWNPSETIDLTAVGSSVEFTGTVTYENVPEWAEAPENLTVKRRVTVKKSEEDPSGGKPGETTETPPAGQPGTPPGKSETPKPPVRQPETPAPEQPDTPEFKKGAEENTGPGRYRVLDANKKTAVLVEIMNKDAAKMNVPATVKIGGVTCKVMQIGDRVFKDGRKLKKVILGKYVAAIGKEAFMNCKKLKTVQLKGNALKKIKPKAFKKTAAKITVIAKKMTKKQKATLRKNLKKAGISKKVKVK